MFKFKWLLVIPIFIALVYFQNCAPSLNKETILSSLDMASEIDQIHRDADHGTTIPSASKPALEQSKSLLDRQMLFALFVDIFGSEAPAKLSALRVLKSERALFGGACSIYDNFNSVRAGLKKDPEAEDCANLDTPSNLSAPLNPSGNVLHQAIINDICQQAVSNTVTYNYILSQLKEDLTKPLPMNSSENALKLFRLFYRAKPNPENSLIESLQNLIGTPATDAGWRLAISTTCVSSEWQAL